jgi:hypothetical protein
MLGLGTTTCKVDGCGQPVANKFHKLCADHRYQQQNGGKTKQQVYMERAKGKVVIKEQKTIAGLPDLKKQYSITKVSSKPKCRCSDGSMVSQVEIKRKTAETYDKIGQDRAKFCQGCGRWDVPLSHSHIIPQARCKVLGKTELIWDKDNIHYHCFNDSSSCHLKWETGNPVELIKMLDLEENIFYLEKHDPEGLKKIMIKLESLKD